jgi:hypothetical protein
MSSIQSRDCTVQVHACVPVQQSLSYSASYDRRGHMRACVCSVCSRHISRTARYPLTSATFSYLNHSCLQFASHRVQVSARLNRCFPFPLHIHFASRYHSHINRRACGAIRIPYMVGAFEPRTRAYRFGFHSAATRIILTLSMQRCSGMLAQLLKIVLQTSSFGEAEALGAAVHASKSPVSMGGKSPLSLAPHAPNGLSKSVSSPFKPRSGLFK